MALFNRKTLARHIKPAAIPADHLGDLEAWAEMIHSGRVHALKETALHGQFAAKIVEGVLGYHGPAGGAEYTVATEQAILRGSVDLALGRFGGKTPEILAPFELKGADIRAHAMICFLALVLYRVMRMRLKAKGHSASPRTALDLLARIQKHTAHIGKRTFNGTSKTTPEQLDLFDALNLPKPA